MELHNSSDHNEEKLTNWLMIVNEASETRNKNVSYKHLIEEVQKYLSLTS